MAHSRRSMVVVMLLVFLVPHLRAGDSPGVKPDQRSSDPEERVTVPLVSEEVSPVEDLRISGTAYAAVRKPPGKGPFPAVIFLHGGLGNSKMGRLRVGALSQVTQAPARPAARPDSSGAAEINQASCWHTERQTKGN